MSSDTTTTTSTATTSTTSTTTTGNDNAEAHPLRLAVLDLLDSEAEEEKKQVAYKTILLIIDNLCKQPHVEKYRSIPLTNLKIKEKLVFCPKALEVLYACGFYTSEDEKKLELASDIGAPELLLFSSLIRRAHRFHLNRRLKEKSKKNAKHFESEKKRQQSIKEKMEVDKYERKKQKEISGPTQAIKGNVDFWEAETVDNPIEPDTTTTNAHGNGFPPSTFPPSSFGGAPPMGRGRGMGATGMPTMPTMSTMPTMPAPYAGRGAPTSATGSPFSGTGFTLADAEKEATTNNTNTNEDSDDELLQLQEEE